MTGGGGNDSLFSGRASDWIGSPTSTTRATIRCVLDRGIRRLDRGPRERLRADVVITLDAADKITLVGTTLASMTQADFLFVP